MRRALDQALVLEFVQPAADLHRGHPCTLPDLGRVQVAGVVAERLQDQQAVFGGQAMGQRGGLARGFRVAAAGAAKFELAEGALGEGHVQALAMAPTPKLVVAFAIEINRSRNGSGVAARSRTDICCTSPPARRRHESGKPSEIAAVESADRPQISRGGVRKPWA